MRPRGTGNTGIERRFSRLWLELSRSAEVNMVRGKQLCLGQGGMADSHVARNCKIESACYVTVVASWRTGSLMKYRQTIGHAHTIQQFHVMQMTRLTHQRNFSTKFQSEFSVVDRHRASAIAHRHIKSIMPPRSLGIEDTSRDHCVGKQYKAGGRQSGHTSDTKRHINAPSASESGLRAA
jgi:hypothetical protein